jgi:photosystem II stability/assembly factor-like uncharacterized protein
LFAFGCSSSFRVLPSEPLRGSGQLEIRYQETKATVHSQHEARIDRVFAGKGSVFAQVAKDPQTGLYVSRDDTQTWTFVPFPVGLLEIDSAGDFLYARSPYALWRSRDAGASWSLAVAGGAAIESIARTRDGRILVAAGGRVYAGVTNGPGLRALALQGAPQAQFRSVAGAGRTLLASVRGSSPKELLPQIREIVDGHTGPTDAALDAKDAKGAVAFGSGMVYVSHDEGGLWTPSSLGLDAWLVAADDGIYAVAADPLLEAAALSRAHPSLAHALSMRLHDQRVDADDVRTALAWPGREALFRGTLPVVFRSTDYGQTWTRVTEVPLQVCIDVARQKAAYPVELDVRETPAPQPPRGRRPGMQVPPPKQVEPHVAAEVLLTFLDPLRLVTQENRAPVTGFAEAQGALWAYAPTREKWESLSGAVVAATAAEGEIWLGAPRPVRGAEAELLRSTDGGATFREVPGLPAGSPTSIAALPGAAYLTVAGHGALRVVP